MPTFVRLVTRRHAAHTLTVQQTPQELVSFINGAQANDHLTFVGVTGDAVMVLAGDLSSADFDIVRSKVGLSDSPEGKV